MMTRFLILAIVSIIGLHSANVFSQPAFPSVARASIISLSKRMETIEVTWSASPSPNITGYNLFEGTVSNALTNQIYTTDDFVPLTVQKGIRYFFAVDAVNSSGLTSALSGITSFSGFSEQVWLAVTCSGTNVYWAPCDQAQGWYRLGDGWLWGSPDLESWSEIIPAPANSIMEFTNVYTALP